MRDGCFALNGRFLGQDGTGVQRYAREVATGLDALLSGAGRTAPVVAPRGSPDPGLRAMPLVEAGPLGGHAWEQATLPARWPGRLLNLGNTGPACKADQVVCIHDANVHEAPGSYGRAFRATYRLLQPALVRRGARVATVSRDSALQLARHLPLRASDVAVLPNGHEHALRWDARAGVAAAGLLAARARPDRPFVLVVGSRARHKNVALLASAAGLLDEAGIDLVVAGGGAGIFPAEDLATRPNLHVVGRVTDDDLALLMDRAACLAFPSLSEGFGLPIVEAMARGCPVVSSDRASMPEVCGDAAVMLPPEDPAAWAAALARVAREPALAADLAGRGRERVRLFSWKDTAEGWLDLADGGSGAGAGGRRPAAAPSVGVVVATRGRPAVVEATVGRILASTGTPPAAVVVSCADASDAGGLVGRPGVTVLVGGAGLAAQRNRALAALAADVEVVAFFDDDFVAAPDWLAGAAAAFAADPTLGVLTGRVVADGIKGPGLSFDEAVAAVDAAGGARDGTPESPFSPYGCNMAFRVEATRGLRFDERLVLYGWLEDRDFGAAVTAKGWGSCRTPACVGAHMGAKSGRVAGGRLGYSQVANPVHLVRKGTMSRRGALAQVARNVASNVARAPRPEAFVDRRGRLAGNARAMLDLALGRSRPERAMGDDG